MTCRYGFLFLMSLLLLTTLPALAQTIPAKGTEATLDVATWNIEWFGDDGENRGPSNDAGQIANVKAVIEQAEIDLWGVQEIADPEDFEALLDALGDGYDGVLATQSGTLRIGFIYKTDVFSNIVFQHILTTASFDFAGRLPLQMASRCHFRRYDAAAHVHRDPHEGVFRSGILQPPRRRRPAFEGAYRKHPA